MLPASSDEENMIGSTARTPKTFSLRPMILFGLLSGMVGVFVGTCLSYQLAFGQGTHFQKTDVASAQGLAAQAAEDAKEDAEKVTDNECYQAWHVTEKDDIMFLKALEMCLENFYCWDENVKDYGRYEGCQKMDEHHGGRYTLNGNPFMIRMMCQPYYVPQYMDGLKTWKATCAPQWEAEREAARTEEAAETEVLRKEVLATRRLTAEHVAEAAGENECVQSIGVGQQRVLHLMNVKDFCYDNIQDPECAKFGETAVVDAIEALQAVQEKCASQFQKAAEAIAEAKTHRTEIQKAAEAKNAEES